MAGKWFLDNTGEADSVPEFCFGKSVSFGKFFSEGTNVSFSSISNVSSQDWETRTQNENMIYTYDVSIQFYT